MSFSNKRIRPSDGAGGRFKAPARVGGCATPAHLSLRLRVSPRRRAGLVAPGRVGWSVLAIFALAACTSANAPSTALPVANPATMSASAEPAQAPAQPADPANSPPSVAPANSATTSYTEDTAGELNRLWAERERQKGGDFALGPGDLINLSCPDDDEFNGQYRISGEGDISLPLVGTVKAAGLTQDALKADLEQRLKRYLRNPQVNLLVGDYRSRQVGVFGAVAKPGVYDLAGPTDTMQNMISLAGGVATDASPRIYFKPGPSANTDSSPMQEPVVTPLSATDYQNSIVVDTDDATGRSFLGLPARPGDVINIAVDGQVMVDGWVAKPGSYPISRDLKVLGAVAAAGGALYPANEDDVKIIRKSAQGQQIMLVNLNRVSAGEAPDVVVQDGDVVEVTYSNAKIVPYGLFEAVTQMFRAGAYFVP